MSTRDSLVLQGPIKDQTLKRIYEVVNISNLGYIPSTVETIPESEYIEVLNLLSAREKKWSKTSWKNKKKIIK